MFNRLIIATLLALFSISHALAQTPGPQYFKLFNLQKNTNQNQVIYEVDPTNTDNPIHAYWIMAGDGHTEELTRMEQNRAYGAEVVDKNAREIRFTIKAFSSSVFAVRMDPETQTPYAVLALPSGEKIVKTLFVTLAGKLIPRLVKIDVYYQDALNGPVMHTTLDI